MIFRTTTDSRSSRVRGAFGAILLVGLTLVAAQMTLAASATLGPGGSFWDDDGSRHEGAIEAVVAAGLMRGCNSPYYDMFCPDATVSRLQAAEILVRIVDLADSGGGHLADTRGVPGGVAADTAVGLGLLMPCESQPLRFCPNDAVERRELGEAWSRASRSPAFGTGGSGGSDYATRIRAESVARDLTACGSECDEVVTRGEMASYLVRVLGLDALVPPPPSIHLISRFTIRYACCGPRDPAAEAAARGLDGSIVPPRRVFSMTDRLGTVEHGYCRTATALFNAIYWAGLVPVERYSDGINYSVYPDGLEAILVLGDHDFSFRNVLHRPVEIRTSTTSTSIVVEIWGDNDGRSIAAEYSVKNGYQISILAQGGPDAVAVTITVEKVAARTYDVTRTRFQNGSRSEETYRTKYRTAS